MHYQHFQSAFVLAALLPLGLGAITWETTTGDIDLSQIAPFDSNSDPANSVPRALEKRSISSAAVCLALPFRPQTGGEWTWKEAHCDRTGADVNTFQVDCFGGRNYVEEQPRKKGSCGGSTRWCVDFDSKNAKGDAANDIRCILKTNIQTWVANTEKNSLKDQTTCSAGWTNKGKSNAKATFDVDVMDSAGLNPIAPAEVYFLLNQKRIGLSQKNDAIVGSGTIVIPPGGAVQACVDAITGHTQILNILGALTSLSF